GIFIGLGIDGNQTTANVNLYFAIRKNHAADSNSSCFTQIRQVPRIVSRGSSIKNCPCSLFRGYPTRREFLPSLEGARDLLSTISSSCLPSAVLTETTASLGCCPTPTVRTFTRYMNSSSSGTDHKHHNA